MTVGNSVIRNKNVQFEHFSLRPYLLFMTAGFRQVWAKQLEAFTASLSQELGLLAVEKKRVSCPQDWHSNPNKLSFSHRLRFGQKWTQTVLHPEVWPQALSWLHWPSQVPFQQVPSACVWFILGEMFPRLKPPIRWIRTSQISNLTRFF